MIAIILAAGSGRRLKISKPKGMLNIFGKPLIQYSIDALLSAGADRIIVCTGFGEAHYHTYFSKMNAPVEVVHNPEFLNSGSLYSLYLVLKELKGQEDIVILDSDILYNIDEFMSFIGSPEKNAIMATNVPEGRYDACYLDVDISNNLIKITKNVNYINSQVLDLWEHIGITKVSAKLTVELLDFAKRKFASNGKIDHEYDYAFEELDEEFKVLKYRDYVWSEVDDNEQLHYMLTNIYPKLNLYYNVEAK